MTTATIYLTDGRSINVTLDNECAPISAENFISLAQSGFYNGLIFHRVIKGFMIQGGGMDENMTPKAANSIKGEFAANGVDNTRKHVKGTISMARTMMPNSASSQFFICSAKTQHLDGQYAAFGEVTEEESLKVIDEISAVKTKRVGYYDDVPETPIIIKNISINE